MERKEIKLWAREKTRFNKWNIWKGYLTIIGLTLLLIFIALLVFSIIFDISGSSYYSSITLSDMVIFVAMVALYIFIIGFATSIYRYIKIIITDDIADLNNLKVSISQYFKQGLGGLAVALACMLGTLAFIIPGFILILGLAMTPYLLANNQEMRIFEAMKTSWKMMQGRKIELIILFFSFYGWVLLSACTMGILLIWLMPYMMLTFNKYFIEIENQYYGNENDTVLFENKNDIEEFAMLNNLKIDRHNNVYGMFNDYPVVVMFGRPNVDLLITINTNGNERKLLDEYFASIQTILTNLKTVNYSDGVITISVTRGNELHEVYEILNRITLKLRDLDFLPSCSTCHLNKPTSFYEYRGKLVNLCNECQDMLINDQENMIEKSSKGVIGALVGALIGGAVWAIVYQIGFIVALVGYLIVYLSVKGYEIMADKISKKGLVICLICSVLALFIAEYISLAVEIMKLTKLTNVFSAFSMIPYFLSFSDIFVVVVKDILIGLVFMAVASWQYIAKINKSLNEQKLNKLD